MQTTKTHKTTCCYCGVGCGVVVTKQRDGQISVAGDPDHPVSQGMLCSKGLNLHYTVNDQSDRLLYPQMRWHRNAPLQRVSWDTALERAAAVFKTFIKKYGPESVAFYASGQCLTEEYYLLNKLMKGFIGSNNLDTNSRLCMSSAVVAYKMALGEDAVPCSYDDIELADCIVIAGANPAWNHPIIFRRIEAHKAANPHVKLVVIDPRKTDTARAADLHLQIKPGTDIVLFNVIAKNLVARGYADRTFIENHTEGYAAFRDKVTERDTREAARICGISIYEIHQAVEYIGHAKGFLSMWTMGLNQSVVGVNKNLALINLHLLTGKIGKPGCGPFSLTGQPNAMGGREVGGLSNLLPAHRNLADPAHRQFVADFWGVPAISDKVGFHAIELFENLRNGKVKAIWIFCTNPMVSLPDSKMAEEALRLAKFVVVQDVSNRSDTVPFADLVLPAAAWGEKCGTMTNSERRVSYLEKFTDAPGEALPDTEIITRFAHKMGFGHAFNYPNLDAIYAEHVKLTEGTNVDMSGLSYERLQNEGTFRWPVPNVSSKGTPRLFADNQFFTPSKRAKLYAVADENPSEILTEQYPLVLNTGRIRDQWHTMTKTGRVKKLNQHLSTAFLEIHPLDAAARHLKMGDIALINSARGQAQVPVQLTTDVRQGVVFMPMHWGKVLGSNHARANNLTPQLIDPASKEPDFKFSAVQVIKYQKPTERIIIIGAGAAAYKFVTLHHELNPNDKLTVFSREPYSFYNRVMLPDYVSGTINWDKLLKMSKLELSNLDLYEGVSIKKIDRVPQTVTDQNGKVYAYDRLIVATGSRANVPRDYPINLEGVFTMRTRHDADRLMQYLAAPKPALRKRVVVVGGGLLGMEMAASLNHMGHQITIVDRSSRLMSRQLDGPASALLHEEVTDRHIDILYNDEVKYLIECHGMVAGARLMSGTTLDADVVIVAMGTMPNLELGREAGLLVNRGICVNAYLQTSDPLIHALGEVAEFEGGVFGITMAAEEQATALCHFLNGDVQRYYRPTVLMNILKMEGFDLCSIGQTEIPDNGAGAGYEEVIFTDRSQRYYKKCVIKGDKLVGAILLGDKSEFMEYKALIQNQTELSEKRLKLLRSGQPGQILKGKVVCSCNNVGEGNLGDAIAAGCADFQVLCQQTGAGMGCGSCRLEVKALFEKNTVTAKQK